MTEEQLARVCILDLARERGPGKTFCPSEVARRMAPDNWRAYLVTVREVAIVMEQEGILRWTQKDQRIDPRRAVGPVRFQLSRAEPPPRAEVERAGADPS